MPPTPPLLASAETRSPRAPRVPCWNAIFAGSCFIGGSRPEGSADEVLVIVLAALVYDKRCGGVSRGNIGLTRRRRELTAPPTEPRSTRYASHRHARANAPARAHAHASGLSRPPGATGGPSSARGGGGGARSFARSRARGMTLAMAVEVVVAYTACHAHHARHSRAHARHHHAPRASSPLSFPPAHGRHARTAAAAALARSLDRAHAV